MQATLNNTIMNILNTQVSYYPGRITDKSSTLTVDLFDFITSTTPERTAKVLKVRACTDEKLQKELKKNVDWITPSGIFTPPCEAADLVKHSGIICLDFDTDANPKVNFEVVKRQVSRLSWVAACTWSIRGRGLAIYVPIKYPEKHHQHFDRLVDEFKKQGLMIDRSCRNVNRARFDTVDPEPYINPEATIYGKLKEPPTIPIKQTINTGGSSGPIHSDIFRWACKIVETRGMKYQFIKGQRHFYIYRLCCILNDYGVSKGEAKTWINDNLIPLSEIRSNCIDGPYKRYPDRFGTKSFTTSPSPSPTFRKPYTVMERFNYNTSQSVERKDWSSPKTTKREDSDSDYLGASTDHPIGSSGISPNPKATSTLHTHIHFDLDIWGEKLRLFFELVERKKSYSTPVDNLKAFEVVQPIVSYFLTPFTTYSKEVIQEQLVKTTGVHWGFKDVAFDVLIEAGVLSKVGNTNTFRLI